MSTYLQKELAKNIVLNATRKKKLTKGQIVELSGYSKSTSTQQLPAVFNQKGVKDALKNDYGLTEELIKTALVDDLRSKKGNRLGEMRLGSDILGLTQKVEGGSKTLVINISGESATRYGLLDNVKQGMSSVIEPVGGQLLNED